CGHAGPPRPTGPRSRTAAAPCHRRVASIPRRSHPSVTTVLSSEGLPSVNLSGINTTGVYTPGGGGHLPNRYWLLHLDRPMLLPDVEELAEVLREDQVQRPVERDANL